MKFVPSGSQTVGPFFNFGLTVNPGLGVIATPGVPGERISIVFRVTDGDGAPAAGDCMLELWQADSAGRYAHECDPRASDIAGGFHGFGRLETDLNGSCTFQTLKPGAVEGPDGAKQAPHINIVLFARGLLRHLHTRLYFEGDPANDSDHVLSLVPPERRATLIARPIGDKHGHWEFDIRLQGENETVFFDV